MTAQERASYAKACRIFALNGADECFRFNVNSITVGVIASTWNKTAERVANDIANVQRDNGMEPQCVPPRFRTLSRCCDHHVESDRIAFTGSER